MHKIKFAIALDQALAWSARAWRSGAPDGPQVRFWRDEVRKAAKA